MLAGILLVAEPVRADRKETFAVLGFDAGANRYKVPGNGFGSTTAFAGALDLSLYYGLNGTLHVGGRPRVTSTSNAHFASVKLSLPDGSEPVGSVFVDHRVVIDALENDIEDGLLGFDHGVRDRSSIRLRRELRAGPDVLQGRPVDAGTTSGVRGFAADATTRTGTRREPPGGSLDRWSRSRRRCLVKPLNRHRLQIQFRRLLNEIPPSVANSRCVRSLDSKSATSFVHRVRSWSVTPPSVVSGGESAARLRSSRRPSPANDPTHLLPLSVRGDLYD